MIMISKKYNKSFAVVPCCVFPTLFSYRELKNNEKVVDYNQLIEYIQEVIDNTLVFFLKVEGRNKVIYKVI